ncbi:MAG: ATP-dependent DNA helicase RecG [Ruminococcaceae bacterium]|nr:ATP-dependent DNA helicase RecG [Oscillospiraceae bacterium]
MLLQTQVRHLKGIGEKRAEQFAALGVNDIDALFHFFPRKYEDLSNIVPIISTIVGTDACVKARVTSPVRAWKSKKGTPVYKTTVADDTDVLDIVIFNNKYAAAKLKVGEEFLFFGRINSFGNRKEMLSPSIEDPKTSERIRPIYRTTGNMSSKHIARYMEQALSQYGCGIKETLPSDIMQKYQLMPITNAYFQIHFPTDFDEMLKARNRFIFEELFQLQLGMKLFRGTSKEATDKCAKTDYSEEFISKLPFEPTGAQKRAIAEATKDIMSGQVMARLLQGDVGSGKTMVAAALMYTMAKNGFQSAIMAPTEILARQHFETIAKFFKGKKIEIILLTGGMSVAEKKLALSKIKEGTAKIAIGTHALFYDSVEFKNLGLVITDEQHRFGVRQRGALSAKGKGVHVLVMSATPIPRTLALTFYGDLDVSVIDELPKGRIPIETYRIDSTIRERAYNYIKKFLDEGRQGYIVCPLVEEGEMDNVLSATEYYNDISKGAFKNYKVGLVHGQMKPDEKAEVMERFAFGEIQLLVATVVIEVGVDVPNAVIMLIENAERFGLSTLHQLRGRVGRGKYKSTCILLSDVNTEKTQARLKVLCDTTDGFKISEKDLQMRGPGDFFGSKQHGLPDLKLADLLEDIDVFTNAGEAASIILKRDPDLSKPENAVLKDSVERLFARVESS